MCAQFVLFSSIGGYAAVLFLGVGTMQRLSFCAQRNAGRSGHRARGHWKAQRYCVLEMFKNRTGGFAMTFSMARHRFWRSLGL